MIKNDKKNRMNGRKMTIHPVFHSLNLSCSIKECKTVRADITVTCLLYTSEAADE